MCESGPAPRPEVFLRHGRLKSLYIKMEEPDLQAPPFMHDVLSPLRLSLAGLLLSIARLRFTGKLFILAVVSSYPRCEFQGVLHMFGRDDFLLAVEGTEQGVGRDLVDGSRKSFRGGLQQCHGLHVERVNLNSDLFPAERAVVFGAFGCEWLNPDMEGEPRSE